MLADRIYMLDPDIQAPMMEGISFAGVDRVGIPVAYAELLIDLKTSETLPSWFVDEGYVGESAECPEDRSHFERGLRAVAAAKALRDTVAVSFETVHPIAWADNVTEASAFGDEVARPL
jgi:hypothetical protein